jgi:hypoxanthine-DNA glycosylase
MFRIAHTEAGWLAGAGKKVIAYIPEMVEPELMYKLFHAVVGNLDDLINSLNVDKDRSSGKNHKIGLNPWVGENPKVLILGTMAGDTSIAAQAYYADPRNPFWKLMEEIFQPSVEDLSKGRKAFITGRGIALWDCIKSGVRLDSSDASFYSKSLKGNDIQSFLNDHPSIHTIILNGSSTTVRYFNLYCNITQPIQVIALPSTASMITYKNKVEEWSILKELLK